MESQARYPLEGHFKKSAKGRRSSKPNDIDELKELINAVIYK